MENWTNSYDITMYATTMYLVLIKSSSFSCVFLSIQPVYCLHWLTKWITTSVSLSDINIIRLLYPDSKKVHLDTDLDFFVGLLPICLKFCKRKQYIYDMTSCSGQYLRNIPWITASYLCWDGTLLDMWSEATVDLWTLPHNSCMGIQIHLQWTLQL